MLGGANHLRANQQVYIHPPTICGQCATLPPDKILCHEKKRRTRPDPILQHLSVFLLSTQNHNKREYAEVPGLRQEMKERERIRERTLRSHAKPVWTNNQISAFSSFRSRTPTIPHPAPVLLILLLQLEKFLPLQTVSPSLCFFSAAQEASGPPSVSFSSGLAGALTIGWVMIFWSFLFDITAPPDILRKPERDWVHAGKRRGRGARDQSRKQSVGRELKKSFSALLSEVPLTKEETSQTRGRQQNRESHDADAILRFEGKCKALG